MLENGEAWSKSHDQRSKIIVCEDERDWINTETGNPYDELNMCETSKITTQKILKFQNRVIVLDDMGNEFNSHIKYYLTEGRHKNFQIIAMCHKPAQINNMSRTNCDTTYITTYNGPDLFHNFNTTFKYNHKFHEKINELNNSYCNCTDGMADELRYGITKYNIKEDTFIIIDRNRTMIYDSRIGILDLEALSLKMN